MIPNLFLVENWQVADTALLYTAARRPLESLHQPAQLTAIKQRPQAKMVPTLKGRHVSVMLVIILHVGTSNLIEGNSCADSRLLMRQGDWGL